MPVYEKRYLRNGVPMPIQCIRMRKDRVKGNLDFHYHDYIELLFGISGSATVYVGTESYPLEAGSMLIVPNNAFHEVDGTGTPSEYLVVKFLPSVLFVEEQTFSEYTYTLLLMQTIQNGKIFFQSHELEGTPISSLFLQMMEEWDEQQFGYELSLRASVTEIILHIMRKWQEEKPEIREMSVTNIQSVLIQNAISHIQSHYADLSEEMCAECLGVSAPYLSRVFKKGMKISFSSYLNDVKLKEAEKMLLSGDQSMTEISETVGFSTVAYFIASFRKKYGITPNQYRKRLRGMSQNEK